MSTQHPDNVSIPFFSPTPEIEGDYEVDEAFYAFSHLGCDEQMWDFEGKDVDAHVVRKLFAKRADFFKERILGRDCFLTYRVPNPAVEKNEGKVLLETLETIPRSYDVAVQFYGEEVPPVFEIILPMTTSAVELERLYRLYKDIVVGKQYDRVHDITLAEWIGEFKPADIHIIPLFEDIHTIINSDKIVEEFLRGKDFPYQRVFLARSDPAENYGYVSAFLAIEIALQKLDKLEEKLGIPILPVFGAGSAPFRGGFKPSNVENCLRSYPSVQTFTVQSAFKYDYPFEVVREAIEKIKRTPRGKPRKVEEGKALDIINRYAPRYRSRIEGLADLVNSVARFVPKRRKRKIHFGLFGYSRSVAGVRLPRAIEFCASLYSIGVPPEVIGFDALTPEDLAFLREDRSFEEDILEALKFSNPETLFSLLPELKGKLPDFEVDKEHLKLTRRIFETIRSGREKFEDVSAWVTEAGHLRGFLG